MLALGDQRAQTCVDLLKRDLKRLGTWSATSLADDRPLLSDLGEVEGDPIIVLIVALMEILTEENMSSISPTLDRVLDHVGATPARL